MNVYLVFLNDLLPNTCIVIPVMGTDFFWTHTCHCMKFYLNYGSQSDNHPTQKRSGGQLWLLKDRKLKLNFQSKFLFIIITTIHGFGPEQAKAKFGGLNPNRQSVF